MELTNEQRKQRLYDLMGRDPAFMRMKGSYDTAKGWFDRFTAFLPRPLRSRLREYPGMMFFMHRRIIETVCKNMRFQDEGE